MTRLRNAFVLVLLLAGILLPLQAGTDTDSELLILVTNDDGYYAPGVRALAAALAPLGHVLVAAPAENQSGTGHSTTSHQFIPIEEITLPAGVRGFSVAARPATCVRLALESLVPRKPDLVVSGINRGPNLGVVSFYSGTVGAAREAALVGIPAIAFSQVRKEGDTQEDYQPAAEFARRLVDKLRSEQRLQPGLFLNVNFPADEFRGVRVTRQSTQATPQIFTRYANPRGDVYYWSGYGHLETDESGTDVTAVREAYISITPFTIDQTSDAGFGWLQELSAEAVPEVETR